MSEKVTDADLHAAMNETLRGYPHFRYALPNGYPINTRFGITIEAMKKFAEQKKASRWVHLMNLPLVIHNASFGETTKVKTMCGSLLKVLDDFASACSKMEGFTRTLKPLWTDAWQVDTPELWSVVGTAFLALSYLSNRETIIGFGRKIGLGTKDADILITIPTEGNVHVEVEAWHATDLTGKSVEENRAFLLDRARSKATKKFPLLPPNERGVVAVVCTAFGEDFTIFRDNAELTGVYELGTGFDRQYLKTY
jgi:hypothetical protein